MQHYLDYNATYPLRNETRDLIYELSRDSGNPSSVHQYGRKSRQILEDSRESVASNLQIKGSRIIWTSGATESNNLALSGFKGKVIISSIEHPSVYQVRQDALICPVDTNGVIKLEILEEMLALNNGALICVMAANNETGVIQPIEEIIKMSKKYSAFVFCDAVQALGKITLPYHDLDMFSLSSHKIGGPLGVGLLAISDKIPLVPLMVGGGQERSLRAGSENYYNIAGFAHALTLALTEDWGATEKMRAQLERDLALYCEDVFFPGSDVGRLPNTSNIYMPNVGRETQIIYFDLLNIYVSGGSACSSGKTKISRVLESMGMEPKIASCCIRVSLGVNTSQGSVERFKEAWIALAKKHQDL